MIERNGAEDGIWIIDAEGRTSYVNESMAEMLGASRSEMLGQSSFDYIFPEDFGAAQRLFAAKKDGHIRPFGFKLRRKDGAAVFVAVQGTPLFDNAGEFKGVVGTFKISR
jgi:PAS domain S-box-containing protein